MEDVVAQIRADSFQSSLVKKLFLLDFFAINQRIDWCSSTTHFILMSALIIIIIKPYDRWYYLIRDFRTQY